MIIQVAQNLPTDQMLVELVGVVQLVHAEPLLFARVPSLLVLHEGKDDPEGHLCRFLVVLRRQVVLDERFAEDSLLLALG